MLRLVEPESPCRLRGRLSASRDGEQWAKELAQLPALQHLVRDAGKGLENGLARVNEQRPKDRQQRITDQLDQVHTRREGRRGLHQTPAQAERAWTTAEEADQKVARHERQGQARTGSATGAVRTWQKAEHAFQQWERAERAVEQVRQAPPPFTPEGGLNTRDRALPVVEALLPQLPGAPRDTFKRRRRRPQTCTELDRLRGRIEALPVAEAVREAVVRSAGIRQNPRLVQGEGPSQGAMRGLLVVLRVRSAAAGQAGQQAGAGVRPAVRYVGRASSGVEGLTSVVRMQQSRHRKMTQELLGPKRRYGHLRQFGPGRGKKTSPSERPGVPLPADLCWWQLLRLTADQLRTLLSAHPAVA